jgi:hypothetical protein
MDANLSVRACDIGKFTNFFASDYTASVLSAGIVIITARRVDAITFFGAAEIFGTGIVIITIGRAAGLRIDTNPIAKFFPAGANAIPRGRHAFGRRRCTNDRIFMPAGTTVRDTLHVDAHFFSVTLIVVGGTAHGRTLLTFPLRVTGFRAIATKLVVAICILEAILANVVLTFFIRRTKIRVLAMPLAGVR